MRIPVGGLRDLKLVSAIERRPQLSRVLTANPTNPKPPINGRVSVLDCEASEPRPSKLSKSASISKARRRLLAVWHNRRSITEAKRE